MDNSSYRHRGSIYYLTLASAIILTCLVLGLSCLILQHRRSSRTNAQIDRAYIYAELGIRHALHFTIVEPQWRNLLSNGKWLDNIAVDQATYSVTGIDPVDGDLQNNNSDPVILTCDVSLNGINRSIQVKAANAFADLLRYAVAAGGNIAISNHARINGDVTTNADFSKTGGDTWVFGDIEAVGTIQDTTNISGAILSGSESKTFPDSQRIIAYYQSRATPIAFQAKIEKILLSPTSNPFGTTNPDGLYMINCNNQKIDIKDCRLVGTLLLLKPQSDSLIESSFAGQPARNDYPVLIVDGTLAIKSAKPLDESKIGVDFNLPGETGYGQLSNILPSVISGVIYSNGSLVLDNICEVRGMVMAAGTVEVKSNASCTYDPNIKLNPPPSFCESYLVPIRGTWQEVNP